MKILFWKRRRTAERGAAAVEMALILPILLLLLAVPFYLARVFWCYTAMQKAAHDAARFLSTATPVEIRTLADDEAVVVGLARAIVRAETAELNPIENQRTISVNCDLETCGTAFPQKVRVIVTMKIGDPIFNSFTSIFTGDEGLPLRADVTMRYVGR
jgi:Flp pilus assembly protein TadG